MNSSTDYEIKFSGMVKDFFGKIFTRNILNLSNSLHLFRTWMSQRRAVAIREKWLREGVQSPPFMIISITAKCNLACKGCYSHAQHRSRETEMSAEKLRSVIGEAGELGTSVILIAGGEPLVRPEIMDITAGFPEIVFPMFTNGLLLNDALIGRMKKQKNLVPIVSLEGGMIETDSRRGGGVFANVLRVMDKLASGNVLYGTSVTVTRENFDTVTSGEFIGSLLGKKCGVFIYVEYVPVREGTDHLTLTEEQKIELRRLLDEWGRKHRAQFIGFPGDEEIFGGCLASGRGFVHISPEGRLEPCPFAPYSDTDVNQMSLRSALASDFLRKIRENHHLLKETRGGCALWENRQWVASLMK
ncbi:MAG: hypothetical protein A2Y33_11475 [Spirochaetes bacterium GWF1_51_8]|nr:MAG: hypothetical protein A2Y33_11475 [Spirochaetes bacterium GWF1_51_8]